MALWLAKPDGGKRTDEPLSRASMGQLESRDSWNLEHVARHSISAREAEEVIENDPYDLDVQIIDGEVRTPQLGETNAGRILIAIAQWIEEERKTRVVTAFERSKHLRRE